MSSRVRNPYKFPIQSRALGDAEHGGAYIQPGQIMTVSDEAAEEACKTGVLQRELNGRWDFDGKVDLKGKIAPTAVPD